LLDFVNDLSGRGRGSIARDVIRKGETPILLVATGASIVGDKMLGRSSPDVVATVVQRSHRFPDIPLQNFLIIRVAETLSSPVFQLVGREGKSIDHALRPTSLRYRSTLRFGGVCRRLRD